MSNSLPQRIKDEISYRMRNAAAYAKFGRPIDDEIALAHENVAKHLAEEIREAKIDALESVFKDIDEQRAALPGYFIDVYGWFQVELKKLKEGP